MQSPCDKLNQCEIIYLDCFTHLIWLQEEEMKYYRMHVAADPDEQTDDNLHLTISDENKINVQNHGRRSNVIPSTNKCVYTQLSYSMKVCHDA